MYGSCGLPKLQIGCLIVLSIILFVAKFGLNLPMDDCHLATSLN
jgi:hypothetical protein